MKKEQHKIDEQTRSLLKKSILMPSSSDFNDQLIKKILLSPSPAKAKSNGNTTKKAWIFFIVAIACFLVSVLIISEYTSAYAKDISFILNVTINYIFYGGLALFIPLVLYHFDSILQAMFISRNNKISLV